MLQEDEVVNTAAGIWENINLKNLEENILPTRQRADLILKKAQDHSVAEVMLRKL
jgi:type I pantothenate kinase